MGGEGDDTYDIRGNADPRQAIEFQRGGRDTIEATGSIIVPPEIERVVASGNEWVGMKAAFGEQTLVGGPKGDVLDGGDPGPTNSRDAGEMTSCTSASGRSIGPREARAQTRSVPKAIPSSAPLPFTYEDAGIRPSAHRIVDLSPGAGDRLLLTPGSFGPRVSKLEHRMVVREGASPAIPPTAASRNFSSRARDRCCALTPMGKGPLPTQIVAILEGFDHVPVRAINAPDARTPDGR